MKISLLILGLFGFLLVGTIQNNNSISAQYMDEFLNIKFILPSDEWEKSHFISGNSNATNFVNTLSNSTFFPESISIIRQVTDNDTSLEEFARVNQEILNSTGNMFSFNQTQSMLAQNPAIEQIYTLNVPSTANESATTDIPIKTKSIFTFVNGSSGVGSSSDSNILYILAYSAEERFFEEYLPIANNLFQSVTISSTSAAGLDEIDTPIAPPGTTMNTTSSIMFEQYNTSLEITHPLDWEMQEFDDGIRLVSPLENSSDRYREILDILIENNADNESVSEHASQILTDYTSRLENFSLVSYETGMISGNPSYELIYGYEDANFGTSQAKDIITVQGDNLYIISFIAPSTNFDSFINEVEEIIDSIRISN